MSGLCSVDACSASFRVTLVGFRATATTSTEYHGFDMQGLTNLQKVQAIPDIENLCMTGANAVLVDPVPLSRAFRWVQAGYFYCLHLTKLQNNRDSEPRNGAQTLGQLPKQRFSF
jgi:hypothetical protein